MCNKSVVMVGHDGTSSEGGRKPGRCWSNKSRSSIQSGFLIRGIIVIFVGGCCGKPYLPAQSADKLNGGGSSWDYDDSVQNYLMEFGYLPKSNIETGNLRTMDQLSEAVKSLQAFANLEPTGKIDGETRELLRRPRCGAPDLAGSNDFLASNSLSGRYRNGGRRQRRFVIQGQKWDHHTVTWR
ncbi:hypothetical protein quinque_007711 [Culex quinquefasciatus]